MSPKKSRSRLPSWLKNKDPLQKGMITTKNLLQGLKLNTVCQEARCPNIGECYARKTATFMILGEKCTRNCQFCAVTSGEPSPVDPREPDRIVEAVSRLGLKHVVITSVTRDDLPDGGSRQFVRGIERLRDYDSELKIEILTPDFQQDSGALNRIIVARPDIFNHNIETVPELYSRVRPEASYQGSLKVLKRVAESQANIITKSGLMLGLGENREQILQVFRDLREVNCDMLTIGQYLQPARANLPVQEYIRPETFQQYKEEALALGFKAVAAGPHVRSSYLAEEISQEVFSQGES